MTWRVLPRGLAAALTFLTRIPLPNALMPSPDDQRLAAPWYPVVGLLVGAVVWTVTACGTWISPEIAALFGVTAWIWITGALHLDGLADVADGLGAAHRDPDRFLEVVRDPHVGSFGVVVLVLAIVAKLLLLAALIGAGTGLGSGAPQPGVPFSLLLIPAWARWGPLVWRQLVPPLGTGRGRAFSERADWLMPAVQGALLCGLSVWLQPALLAALPLALLVTIFWRWRLQGMTGDCHGASIEAMELMLLFAVVAAGGSGGY